MATKVSALVEWCETRRRDIIPLTMLKKNERSIGSVVEINKHRATVLATGGTYC